MRSSADVQSARVEPGLRIWWLGQSGFLVQFEGHHLLVDPYLSDSLTFEYAETETPHVRITRRVIAPERLSFVDAVLATHGHGDHLDEETLKAIGAPVLCPSRIVDVARERSGVEPIGLAEGEAVGIGNFQIEAVPAVHHGEHCCRLRDHRRRPARLPLGRHAVGRAGRETASTWRSSRSTASWEMSTRSRLRGSHTRSGAKLAVPCHFDMFEFNTTTPDEFVAECERLGQPYRVLQNGERLSLD